MKTKSFDLEYLFEISPDLLCFAGYDGYLRKINSAVSETLEYSFEELYSNPINNFIHPDDRDKTSSIRQRLINKNSIINFENRYITKSGQVVWLSWTAKASDKDEVIFAIAKNITSKKKEEIDRINHISKLSSKNKNLKNLSYTTSHDLRAPIDNILSVINLIDTNQLNQENKYLLELIKTSTKNLKTNLNSFIDDLRSQQASKTKIEIVDFNECLTEGIFPIKNLMKASKLVVKTDFSEVQNVTFSKTYLESIFLNLVSNAIKYARPNVTPEVFIYTKIEDGIVQLFVQDNGLGFDLEKSKNKIFKLHQTFHENKDSKGIGLYLVNIHVTSLGGTITLDSEENKGSTFIITFDKDLKV